ncbi:MAG: magnesium/cobalt transporter CorA [Clostridia bacterium]|nr:magnesium/cobalt transporter CorA [Clostridia bacterium]
MKSKSIKSALAKVGSKPGSIVYTGDKNQEPVSVTLISYDKNEYTLNEIDLDSMKNISQDKVNWININGLHNEKLIEEIGGIFNIDSLILEDIVTVGGRPKYDKYDHYSFIILSMLSLGDKEKFLKNEQLSIIISGNTILTFQEVKGDVFEHIRKRIYENKGKIRSEQSAYLFYCLIDAIIDQYFYILEAYEEKIESLEAEIMQAPDHSQSKGIYNLRRELLSIRNAIWPIRDMLNNLISEETIFNTTEIRYLNDANDNVRQIMDFISTYRDLVMGLYETYLSNLSNKMNRIMTTLTIISVIFMPLTFLVGVYGMNFHYMPELSFKYAYPVFWIVCVLISIGLYRLFKKKNWFI